MFDTLERFFYWMTSFGVGGDADALCQLRAPLDDTTLVTESNSLVTFYRVVGSRRFIGETEFNDQAAGLAKALANLLKAGHGGRMHSVLFGFRSNPEGGSQVLRDVLGPSLATANRLGADARFLFEDRLQAMTPDCVEEIALFGVMTHTAGLSPAERKRWEEQRAAAAVARAKLKPEFTLDGTVVQTPNGPPSVMLSRHQAALATLEDKLSAEGGAVRVMMDKLPCDEAVALLRRYSDAEFFDPKWRPHLLGRRPAAVDMRRSTRTGDTLMPVRIGRQLFTESLKENFGDVEMVKRGRTWYASISMDVAPLEEVTPGFADLVSSIGRQIPWQVHLDVRPNGMDSMRMEKALASFVGSAGDHNKAIKRAFDELEALKAAGESICSLRAVFTTWALSESSCVDRLAFLKSKVEGWGQSTASNETGAPAHAFVASVPGFSKVMPAAYLPGPLSSFVRMAPMFRPSSVWSSGQFVPFTRDGRPYPIAFGTSQQLFWGTLVFAPTGSGKSFAMNMINAGILFTPGATELPMVCVIDKGPSAKGVVMLAKAMLPKHLADQVVYLRPTPSDISYCINPFDTQLGCDRPLPADRDFLQAVLGTMVPGLGPEAGKFFGRVIDVAYDLYGRTGPRAKRWQWNTDARLSQRLTEVGIEFDEGKPPRVWDIVDAFMRHGMPAEAGNAQRHAVPLLTDLSTVVQDQRIQDLYGQTPSATGEPMVAVFNRNIAAAAGEYKLMSSVTRHNSDARFVVIDMEGLATASVSEEGRARYGLMMLFARRLGARNFFLHKDDLEGVCPPQYLPYHMERLQKIGEQLKFLEYDEIHNAKGIGAVRDLLEKDAREGRKYNVTAILASQDLEDFPKDLVKNCYNFFIMGAGNAEAGRELQHTFELTDSEVRTILAECTQPGRFFGLFRTKRGMLSQLLYTKVGPVEKWAYSTTRSDTSVRDALYEEFGVRETLSFLAKRFPSGSCVDYLERMRREMGVSDADDKGITEGVLKQLRPQMRQLLEQGAPVQPRERLAA